MKTCGSCLFHTESGCSGLRPENPTSTKWLVLDHLSGASGVGPTEDCPLWEPRQEDPGSKDASAG